MRVKLLLNIGKPDAKRLGLKHDEAHAGKVVTVDDEAGDDMLKRGWATDKFDEPKPVEEAVPVNSAGQPSVVGDLSAPAPNADPPGKAPGKLGK